jgi:hypothetical protein
VPLDVEGLEKLKGIIAGQIGMLDEILIPYFKK